MLPSSKYGCFEKSECLVISAFCLLFCLVIATNVNYQHRRIADLRRHIRCLHSTVRPFQCPTCGTGFARSDVFHHHVEFCRHPNSTISQVKRTGRGGSRVSLNGVVSPAIIQSGVSGIGPNSVHKYTDAYGMNPLQAAAQANVNAAEQTVAQADDRNNTNSYNNINDDSVRQTVVGVSSGYTLQQPQQQLMQSTPKQSFSLKEKTRLQQPTYTTNSVGRETRKKRIDYSKYDLPEDDEEFQDDEQLDQDDAAVEEDEYEDDVDDENYED